MLSVPVQLKCVICPVWYEGCDQHSGVTPFTRFIVVDDSCQLDAFVRSVFMIHSHRLNAVVRPR